jgi:hypothetical protein
MLNIKPVGRGASSHKYDLITALGAHALSLGKTDQRRVLRLITLVTARYNWARDELAVGQREIAQLWSCDERTVKRETALLRGLGWLVVKRQGTRGRVTEYGVNIERILKDTSDSWASVGPDFQIRLERADTGQGADRSVVPFPKGGSVAPPDVSSGTEWALALAILHREDMASFGSWLSVVTRDERAGGRLTLRAPSRFHAAYVQTHLSGRILNACRAVDGKVSEIVVIA